MWKETSGGTFSVLHAFSNSTDGEDPGNLQLVTSSGDFYGTAGSGGANLGGTLWKYVP